MTSFKTIAPCLVATLAAGPLLAAPQMQFDFNDLNLGDLINQVDDSPNSSGDWDGGSFVPEVANGSLSAPGGLNYAFSAGGISRHAIVTRSDAAYRGQFHNVTPTSGVVWVSALIRAANLSAAAVVFDGADTSDLNGYGLLGKPGFGIRPNASAGNTELFWSDDLSNLGSNQSVTLPTDYSNQTVLVLARIDFGGTGNDVDLWLNPVLTSAAALGATGDLEAATARNSMSWIGLGAVDTGLTGYTVEFDNILVSGKPDEEESFADVTGLPFAPGPPPEATADLNGNGLPDHSELLYPGLSDLPPTDDTDGDGSSNGDEAAAGTNPFDAASSFKTMSFEAPTPDDYELTFSTVPGRRYQIELSDTLEVASWTPLPDIFTATGTSLTVSIPAGSFPSLEHSFARALILSDLDSDADGLEDSLEEYLGFSTTSNASVRSSATGGDYQQFANLMTGGNVMGGMAGTSSAGVPSDEQASRFLTQATWGPSEAKIAELKALGPNPYEQWIDQQLLEPANLTWPYVDLLWDRRAADVAANWATLPHYIRSNSSFAMYRENLNSVWMRLALFADDELRQRMAWSLSQILVIGPRCNSYGLAASSWYDTLLVHSFGSYRDLLYDISVHPWMGWWLSHIGNRKADPTVNQLPDENFAREIMQLFSIGLWELNMDGTQVLDQHGEPIPTYTNEDITQLARVFTGLDGQSGYGSREVYAATPMQMIESRHDDGDAVMAAVYGGVGEKVFLGQTLPTFANDPGRTGLDDVNDAVDILINHPSCPPFISKNLIQHMVTSNPSPAYVERVANVFADDGTGVRGNLGAVVKAILLDPEARDLSHALDPEKGRLKGPMLRTVAMARALEAGAATPALHDLTGIQFWSPSKDAVYSDFLEYPFQSPSVFNFYEPGFSRPGEVRDMGLLSPEFQIMNALTATTVPNRVLDFIEDGFHDDNEKNPGVVPDFSLQFGDLEAISTDTSALIDRLNLLFANGTLSAEARAEIRSRVDHYAATVGNADERARLALFLTFVSPDGAVLK